MVGLVTELENIAGGNLGAGIGDVVKSVGDAVNEKAVLANDLAKTEIQAQAQEVQSDVEDRTSARYREVGVKDKTPMVLAYGITLGFFGILAYMMKYDIPPANKTELDLILGSLGTAWIAVVSYYFGSRSSSRAKDDTIGNMARPWVNPDKTN